MSMTRERAYLKDERLKAQGERCAVCGDHSEVRQMHLDHDHECCSNGCARCVRGVLCLSCNLGLGQFRDRPDLLRYAAAYLDGIEYVPRDESLFGLPPPTEAEELSA